MTTLFFAIDVHGSGICWGRFLNVGKFYGVDRIILGGDMTGKGIVPFLHQGGKNYRTTLLEQVFETKDEEKLTDLVKHERSPGYYPFVVIPENIAEFIPENLTTPN